jgi:hypothetical protein
MGTYVPFFLRAGHLVHPLDVTGGDGLTPAL